MAKDSLFLGAGDAGVPSMGQPQSRHFEPALSASDEVHLVGELPGTGTVRAAMDAVIGQTGDEIVLDLGASGPSDFDFPLISMELIWGDLSPEFILLGVGDGMPVNRRGHQEGYPSRLLDVSFEGFVPDPSGSTDKESLGSLFAQTGGESEVDDNPRGLLKAPVMWIRNQIKNLREKLLVDKGTNS